MATPRLPYPSNPTEYLQAPAGGWSPDIPTWELAADQAPLLENFQIKPGKLRVRPAYRVTADLTATAPSLAGWVPLSHGVSCLTKRVFTSGYQVEPQNVHRVGRSVPNTAGVVTQIPISGTITFINGATVSTVGLVTGGPGCSYVNFNGTTYAITYGGLNAFAYDDGVTGYQTHVAVITPFGGPSLYTGAPVGGFAVYGWLNRMWVAGGQIGGSAPAVPSTTVLFFTNPLQQLTGAASDWQDPVSTLYNQINIDGDHSDPIVALASVPAGLLIMRQNSVFILRGTDPTSYVIRPVSKQAGCLDARSVVEMDSKVYFMSDQGLVVTDGTRVQNISGALQDELYRQIAWFNLNIYNGSGAWCTCDQMSDGKILVSMGAYSTGNSSINYPMAGAFSAVFDPATGAWVKVSTAINPTQTTNLGPSIQGYGELTSLGNTQVVKIEDNVVGFGTSFPSSLHDVATVTPGYVPITAKWTTKSFGMALSSRLKNHLKLAYLDYAVSTAAPTGTVSLTLADHISGVTVANASVAASTNASDPRQYLERDVFGEATDLAATVTLAGGGTGSVQVAKAEVHGLGVSFQPSSDMRPIV